MKKYILLPVILTLLISCANAQSQTYSYGGLAHVDGSIENSFSEHQAIEELGISQEDFYGTWVLYYYDEDDGELFAGLEIKLSNNRLIQRRGYVDANGILIWRNAHFNDEILFWNNLINTDSETRNDYPTGFRVTISHTFEDSSNHTYDYFIHNDKKTILVILGYVNERYYHFFEKQ